MIFKVSWPNGHATHRTLPGAVKHAKQISGRKGSGPVEIEDETGNTLWSSKLQNRRPAPVQGHLANTDVEYTGVAVEGKDGRWEIEVRRNGHFADRTTSWAGGRGAAESAFDRLVRDLCQQKQDRPLRTVLDLKPHKED